MFPINQFIIFFSKKTVNKVLYDIIAFNVSSIYIGGIGTVWTQKGTKEKPTIFNKISTNFSPKTHTRKIDTFKDFQLYQVVKHDLLYQNVQIFLYQLYQVVIHNLQHKNVQIFLY